MRDHLHQGDRLYPSGHKCLRHRRHGHRLQPDPKGGRYRHLNLSRQAFAVGIKGLSLLLAPMLMGGYELGNLFGEQGNTLDHVLVARKPRGAPQDMIARTDKEEAPMLRDIKRRVPASIKKPARRLINRIGALCYNEPLMGLAELYLRQYYTWDTKRLWGGPHPPPEWFDHRADLYRWSELRNSFWVERGVFSREVMFEGCRVLDLCCGDGFYPYHFYADIASHVDAVDRDPTALAHARKWHSHPKISYVQGDVVTDDFPWNEYDVITWDGAIEHFRTDQTRVVLEKCVDALKTPGVLCDYTIIARSSAKSHPEHQHEFGSAAELKKLLGEFFPSIGTVETEYPERHNIYFRAAFHPTRL